MPDVRLPDGRIIKNVPEGMTQAELMRRLNAAEAPKPQGDGFLDRVRADRDRRREQIFESIRAQQRGEQGGLETAFQKTGAGAGFIFDVLGEGLVSAGRGLSAITPDPLEEELGNIFGEKVSGVVNAPILPLGRNLDTLPELGQAVSEASPRTARNIGAGTNIALLAAPPVSTGTRAAGKSALKESAKALDDIAGRQVARNRQAFVEDLVLPKQTAAIRRGQVEQTIETGLLRRKKVIPSPREAQMVDDVVGVSGVKGSNTLQGNWNVLNKEVSKEAEALKMSLAKSGISIPKREVGASLDRALVRLGENPVLVGDARRTAERIVSKAKQLIDDAPGTPGGILQARKDLDKWIAAHKPKVFDPNVENAMTAAVREVRQTINKTIIERSPSVAVRRSLNRQSNLLRAMENVQLKAADEAASVMQRIWNRTLSIMPVRNQFNQLMATAVGVGGLGATAMFAPMFTKGAAVAAGSFAFYKLLTTPATKRILANGIRAIDDAIRVTTDPRRLAELRADRAALLEFMKLKPEDVEPKQ